MCVAVQVHAAVSEVVVNPMLRVMGYPLYWWVMYPLWCLLIASALLASVFQILAFQPPQAKTPVGSTAGRAEVNRRPTKRAGGTSMSSWVLADVTKLAKRELHALDAKVPTVTIDAGLDARNIQRDLRESGMSACSACSATSSQGSPAACTSLASSSA